MAETVERSLRSILNQIDDRFEVLVVDDGSTDGSIKIIERLVKEYDNLRLVISDNQNVGEARQEAVECAEGEYILPQLDVDDVYKDVIMDFVRLYHQIEDQIERRFFLKGRSINMAPTKLLIDIPYRSLGYGEDKDLWRRLFATDSVIWLDHHSPCRTIGYERGLLSRIRVTYETTVVQFRSGITFWSFVRYTARNPSIRSIVQNAMSPFAYLSAAKQGRYDLPEGYERMGKLEEKIDESIVNATEIEKELNLEIDHSKFSKTGRKILFSEK